MPAQPATSAAASAALIVRARPADVGLIHAFAKALTVARQVDGDAVALAVLGVELVLRQDSEDRIAVAEVVPVGLPAAHVVQPGAAGEQEDGERQGSHTRPTRRRARYSCGRRGLSPSWSRCPRRGPGRDGCAPRAPPRPWRGSARRSPRRGTGAPFRPT